MKWPRDSWTLLLQSTLVGKAREAYSALSIEESFQYEVVKAAVLKAYELVPEAYKQNFVVPQNERIRPTLNLPERKRLYLTDGVHPKKLITILKSLGSCC